MKQKIEILEQYNDKLSAIYDEATSDRDHPWVAPRKIEELTAPYAKQGCEVLDIGIGTGRSSKPLFKKGCKITGIDISKEMIAEAASKFPEWKIHKQNIEEGFSFLEDKRFDIIIASGALEFVSDIKKVLKNISELLKPSGKICFTYEKLLEESRLQKWKEAELGKGIANPIPELLSFLVYRHTKEEITKIMNDLNLEVLQDEEFTAYHKTVDNIPVIYGIVLAEKK
ncbi:MAG: class I SAM-dependent methyltransferase [Candidatus Colwellbacteria bacterium]|nr:class I SAM-dependent methyltransferase [Candidatus Colwellbacteria bacterium]